MLGYGIILSYDINVGVHYILGLPFAKRADVLSEIDTIASLGLWAIKFHVLHILKDTTLAREHAKEKIDLLTSEEYIDLVSDCIVRLPKDMVILRLVSSAIADQLISPLWINRKAEIIKAVIDKLIATKAYQGQLFRAKN